MSPEINLLVGSNNSGKSVILQSIYALQSAGPELYTMARRGVAPNLVSVEVVVGTKFIGGEIISNQPLPEGEFRQMAVIGGHGVSYDQNMIGAFSSSKEESRVLALWSNRKLPVYDIDANLAKASLVNGTLSNLNVFVDSVLSQGDIKSQRFQECVRDILNIEVKCDHVESGRAVGEKLGNGQMIRLESLGDGVPHLLWLIGALTTMENRIFVIEEMENDLHPRALKKLCDLIVKASENNQFFISTHSNIVIRHLAEPSTKVFKVSKDIVEGLPTTSVLVAESFEERMDLLQELGYSHADYYLHQAYLILEESSMERLIRQFLIPWFAPNLIGKLQTIAADGVADVEPRFREFRRLFTFLYKADIYRNNTWVVTDGDQIGRETIITMRAKFGADFNVARFHHWKLDGMEEYLPGNFKERGRAIKLQPEKLRWNLKKELYRELFDWIMANEDEAMEVLKGTADEILEYLSGISTALNPD